MSSKSKDDDASKELKALINTSIKPKCEKCQDKGYVLEDDTVIQCPECTKEANK
jgi:Zn finger protein HypA/HybF involved in hydrogenase expression